MGKKHVVVLMGGMSTEHEVSMASGRKVAESLNRERYDVSPVVIAKEGLWQFPNNPCVEICDAAPLLKQLRVDCVFIALHGAFGEDGRLQGLLDLLGIPYTSSGCAASALAIDKIHSKAIVRGAGVRVAPHITFDRPAWENDAAAVLARVASEIGFPCVAKSPCQGSSIGMAIVQNADEFRAGIPEVLRYGDVVMAEKFVSGTEVTCGVLDVHPGEEPVALPVTEIRPVSSEFFDYYAKYTPGASEEITPAPISPELTSEVQAMAIQAHKAMGCSIWSRNDMMIGAEGPVWIEINTIPGLTPTSLYPQAAAAVGISYAEMLGLFVEAAIAGQEHARKGTP